MRALGSAIVAAAIACFLPAPASQGFVCDSDDGSLKLSVVLGPSHLPPAIVRIFLPGRLLSTDGRGDPLVVGRSRHDGNRYMLDLLDAEAMRYEGRLRLKFVEDRTIEGAQGTLVREGREFQVTCHVD